MKKTEIIAKIRRVTEWELFQTVEDANDSLRDDLFADSLDIVSLAMQLEDEFDTVIPDCDRDEWVTVGDIYLTIIGLIGAED